MNLLQCAVRHEPDSPADNRRNDNPRSSVAVETAAPDQSSIDEPSDKAAYGGRREARRVDQRGDRHSRIEDEDPEHEHLRHRHADPVQLSSKQPIEGVVGDVEVEEDRGHPGILAQRALLRLRNTSSRHYRPSKWRDRVHRPPNLVRTRPTNSHELGLRGDPRRLCRTRVRYHPRRALPGGIGPVRRPHERSRTPCRRARQGVD
jgi:hypothetical protein